MSTETALSYAALILADSDVEISTDNLLTLTKAAKIDVEGIWADIFSKALESQNIKDLLTNFSAGAAPAEEAEEEEEAKEESDEDMGFGLFD
ncbi:ribosomal protein P1A [Hanseniaspora vineae]